MRKNGSRLISIKQYRFTDLFLFAVILLVAELIAFFAAKILPQSAYYTVSFSIPIILIVMMRWGWPSVIYAVFSGLVVCLLHVDTAKGIQYACYLIGNSFIALMLLPRYLIGAGKIASKWWAVALFAIGGWLCVYLGRSVIWAIGYAISPVEKLTAASGFVIFCQADLLSLVMGVVVLIVLRKLDGMLEDQQAFLRRVDNERREKQRIDTFGEEGVELDEEALEILRKDDGGLY